MLPFTLFSFTTKAKNVADSRIYIDPSSKMIMLNRTCRYILME